MAVARPWAGFSALTAALKEAKDGITIRHSGSITSKIDEARKILGISVKYYTDLETLFKQLASYKPGKAEVEGYFDKVVFGEELKNRDMIANGTSESGKNMLVLQDQEKPRSVFSEIGSAKSC